MRAALAIVVWLWAANGAVGQVFSTNFVVSPAKNIPDNNASGIPDVQTVSGGPTEIADVNVLLNISGTFNGDLYVTLSHGIGFSVLLNRVGRRSGGELEGLGYADRGFNITLDDQQASDRDVHTYRVKLFGSHTGGFLDAPGLTGTWQPDARNVDPAIVLDTSARTAYLSSFNGLNANGDWTLFLADLNAGATSSLNSWGLEITPVPEPGAGTIVTGMLCLAGAMLYRWSQRPRRINP